MPELPRAAVVGDPVEHSLSPKLFALWAAWRERPLAYEALRLAVSEFPAALKAARSDVGWVGWNVTVPHKERALELADVRDPSTAQPGAANVLLFRSGEAVAFNTDAAGFMAALDAAGAPTFGARAVVLGAGGAAGAVLAALRRGGAAEVAVFNRSRARAEALAARFGVKAGTLEEAAEDLAAADLVVNATSAGLSGASPLPAGTRLKPGAWAMDLMYRPRETPFMAQAREAGARPLGGLGMLVRQAALTWWLFYGETLPEDVVAAAQKELEGVL